MLRLLRFFLFILFSGIVSGVGAQTQDSYDYQSEFTWGISKNTYSGLIGGFFFKKAKKISDRVLQTYGLEIVNVKHPQELKRTSPSTGNLFIFGKSNYLYALRFQYGRDKILFRKAPQQGVEIKAVFAVGPTIGLVSPYYVDVGESAYPNYVKYDASIDPNTINGVGTPLKGLFESKIKPGVNVKAAINFEMGTVKSQLTGFEAGVLIEAYAGKVIMMPEAKNYAIYPTLFIAIFYGSRK